MNSAKYTWVLDYVYFNDGIKFSGKHKFLNYTSGFHIVLIRFICVVGFITGTAGFDFEFLAFFRLPLLITMH